MSYDTPWRKSKRLSVLGHQNPTASKLYKEYLSLPLHVRGIEPANDAFIKWRLKELQTKASPE